MRRVLVLTLVLLLGVSPTVFGARKQTDEGTLTRYLTTPEHKLILPMTDDTAGFTYWEAQHINSMRRQIAKGNDNTLHFTWMNLVSSDTLDSRYISYNNLNPAYPYWLVYGGLYVMPPSGRGGYTGLDILPDDREVIAFHQEKPTPNLYWGTVITIDYEPGLALFHIFDIPDSVLGSSNKGMWPSMACAKQGDTSFIHIVHAEGGIGQDIERDLAYVRCFEKSAGEDTLVCQSPGWDSPLLIPCNTRLTPNRIPFQFASSRLASAVVVTSPVSQEVALVWLQSAGSDSTQNEVWYRYSYDNGSTWGASFQVTDYASSSYVDRAYPDIAAVYDYDNDLHIIWTTFKSTNQNDVTLWHHSRNDDPPGVSQKVAHNIVLSSVEPGVWNLPIAKMTIGVEGNWTDPAYNYLYCVYTGFKYGDISAGGYANGDLYLQGSSNGGHTWGPAVNLTNTATNGCTAGNCKSEHWASVAERVDDTIYVQYVYDRDAGDATLGEGTFTLNPVRYLKYPRPLVPAIPIMEFNPTAMIDPVRWAPSGGTAVDSIKFDNIGTATLNVQLSGPGWLNISPNMFNIPEAGPTQDVTLTFNAGALSDIFLVDSLRILSNHNGTNDTAWVRIHFAVGQAEYVEFHQMDFNLDGTITNNTDWGATDLTFTGASEIRYLNLTINGSWQVQNLPILSTEGENVTQQQRIFIDLGNAIGTDVTSLNYNYSLTDNMLSSARSGITPAFVVDDRIVIYNGGADVTLNPNPPSAEPLIGGQVSDTVQHKKPNFPNQEAGPNECVPTAVSNSLQGLNSWHNLGMNPADLTIDKMKQATNWDSDGCWIWHDNNRPPGEQNAWWEDKDAYMKANPQKYPITTRMFPTANISQIAAQIDSCQDVEAELGGHTVAVVGIADLGGGKYQITIAHDVDQDDPSGGTIVQPGIWDGNSWDWDGQPAGNTLNYFVVECPKRGICGDANGDGKITVSDIVYLINFLFKGGPPPVSTELADVNGDGKITVSDIVYLINYLFKGGPAPACP